jgi:hypothetical protein
MTFNSPCGREDAYGYIPKSDVSGGLKLPQSAAANKEFATAACIGILAEQVLLLFKKGASRAMSSSNRSPQAQNLLV